MRLFFRMSERRHLREFKWEEKGRWKELPLGHCAVELVNEFLRQAHAETPDTGRLAEMTGLAGEEELVHRLYPLAALAAVLATGAGRQKLEELASARKLSVGQLACWFNGQDTVLWDIWGCVSFVPFWAQIGRGSGLGFLAVCKNVLEAAAVELVLMLVLGVRKPFELCFDEEHVAFHYGTCPVCGPETEKRARFLILLRQHKHRISKGQLSVDDAKRAVRQISRLQKALREGMPLEEAVERHAEFCRAHGLPVEWLENYVGS